MKDHPVAAPSIMTKCRRKKGRSIRRIFDDLVTVNHSLYITEHRTDEI